MTPERESWAGAAKRMPPGTELQMRPQDGDGRERNRAEKFTEKDKEVQKRWTINL